MTALKVTIQDIISTTVASTIRQQRNRGHTLFQILRPASNFGISPTNPVFVRRKAQTPWKVYKVTKVKPVGDGRKSRVWADVYFGGVLVQENKRLTGVNKRGVWKLINPMEINILEDIYVKESIEAQKWSEIVQQDDRALDKRSKSVWNILQTPEDERIEFLNQAKKDLIALMRKRYESAGRHRQFRSDSKVLLEEESEDKFEEDDEQIGSEAAEESNHVEERAEEANEERKPKDQL